MSTLKANKYQHVDRSSPSIEINSDGTVSISSTVTYEDVTSVDSVGIITGRGNVDAKAQVLAGTGVSIAAGGLNVTAGVGTFAGNVSIADKIIHTGDTNTALRFPSADTITAETAGSERLRITSAGSVGINSTSPDRRFTLQQDATCRMNLKSLATSTAGIEFGDEADHNAGYIVYDNTDNSFQVGVNGTGEKLRIDANGQIGIRGTTTAFDTTGNLDGALQLYYETDQGQASIGPYSSGGNTHLSFYTNAGGAAATEKLRILSDGKMGLGMGANNPTGIFDIREDNNPQLTLRSSSHADNGGGRLNFAVGVSAAPQDGNTMCSIASTIHSTSGGTLKGDMKFYTNGGDDLEERMRIESTGKVNIGAGGNTAMNGSGLKIYWATYPSLQLQNSTTGTNSTDGSEILLSGDSHSGLFINNRENSIIRFGTNNTERLRIYANGEAGFTGIVTASSFVPTQIQTGHKNIIVNGAMNVAQRGTSDTSDAQGYTTVDRWKINWSGADSVIETHQETLSSSDSGPWQEGFRKSYALVNGNQSSGANPSDKASIEYRVEAQDISSCGWNYTSSSSYITLSFWIMSTVAQTFQGYLYTFDGTPYKYPFDTGALSANTWKKVTLTIPGDSNLTITQDNGEGFLITLWPFIGTAYTASGVTNLTWSTYAGSSRTKDSASTWWTTDNAGFEITGVQLEVGSKATPFEHLRYGDDLARCQRYYEEGAFSTRASGTVVRYFQAFNTTKRTNATVNVYYDNTKQTAGTINSGNSNNSGWNESGYTSGWNMEKNTGTNGDGVDYVGWYTASAEF